MHRLLPSVSSMSAVTGSWLAVALLAKQILFAAAYPQLYAERHNGCAMPRQGYKGHGPPQENRAISFAVFAQNTTDPVQQWKPDTTYDLWILAATDEPVNAWIYASSGQLRLPSESTLLTYGVAPGCTPGKGSALYSTRQAGEHKVAWTAPGNATDNPCMIFTSAQALSSEQSFQMNGMTFCSAGTPIPSTDGKGIDIPAKDSPNAVTDMDTTDDSGASTALCTVLVAFAALFALLVL